MESKKADINLPATFTCTLLPAEAATRILAAKRHEGVEFALIGKSSDGRKVIGQTIVTNLKEFDKFNAEVLPKI
jgi:hypothetical protein